VAAFERFGCGERVSNESGDERRFEQVIGNSPALEAVLEQVERPKGAATKLGLKRTTLIHKMQKLGISRPVLQNIEEDQEDRPNIDSLSIN
jgi:transcriptional regulator with GAF, ATPase, and Fis domain